MIPTPDDPPADTVKARPYLAAIDRTVRPGCPRYELSTFFASPNALRGFSQDIIDFFKDDLDTLDAFIGLDALGFIVAGALGGMTGKPMIPARKGGKLALPEDGILRTSHISDYLEDESKRIKRTEVKKEKMLEVRKDLIKQGMNVIVVDEWVDTGGQMTSLIQLLEANGAKVVGLATLHIDGSKERGAKLWTERKVFAANATPLSGAS